MSVQVNKTPCCLGLLAHVDSGKTTLSEALLYTTGQRRTLGRVDHADAFLDTYTLERQRGITIFSKQALLSTDNLDVTLVDTPGHVDFGAEAERVMPILDCAVLLISGTDGVQAHTLTLWNLLVHYKVPTFLFVNKMDLAGANRQKLLESLHQLSPKCMELSEPENVAMCSEKLMNCFLETGELPEEEVRRCVAHRELFPVCFGSALRLEGIEQLLDTLNRYAPRKEYENAFSARVYKISRDAQGNRLTWLKILGGSLSVRELLSYKDQKEQRIEEKIVQLRRYSGDKYTTVERALPGQTVAATGLSGTFIGQLLGAGEGENAPILEPIMTYRVNLPTGSDPAVVLPKLRQLEEEEPLLHIGWDGKSIRVQIMGKVQLEVFRHLVKERFDLDVTLDSGHICYKETIGSTVEGVGHYEPLRHYAEVHLLLEPGKPGSGIQIDSGCPPDVLDGNFQNLILTHIGEKTHRGILIGAPLTDVKITLLVGRAHLKHTEGGDFRQATYRAIRQGLMQASPVLLEPWYRFLLTAPANQIGRAISDVRAMGGEFDPPQTMGAYASLQGSVPASELGDYAETLAAYTQGLGRLQLSSDGYRPCHNTEKVVAEENYDPEADLENTPDSVFCAHGAGFTVKWDQVKDYMHLESGLKTEKPPQVIQRNLHIDDRELEAIMEREFGPIKRPQLSQMQTKKAEEEVAIRPPKPNYLIVDGYNVLFAWEEAAGIAKEDLDAARRMVMDGVSSFAAFRKWEVLLVFDGYKMKGNPGEKFPFHNIQVVFTRENETADSYIEALAAQIGSNYQVRVATSDALVQLSSLRSGVLRMSSRELLEEMAIAQKEMKKHYSK